MSKCKRPGILRLTPYGRTFNVTKARLIIAGSENCADLYWATRFYVPDPIIFLEHKGEKILIASD